MSKHSLKPYLREQEDHLRTCRNALLTDLNSADCVHELRVATRKIRGALALLGDTGTELDEALRWLTRTLGSARDLDVQISRSEEAMEAGDNLHSSFLTMLVARRNKQAAVLKARLNQSKCKRLIRQLEIYRRNLPKRGKLKAKPLERKLRKKAQRIAAAAQELGLTSSAKRYHKLRIRGKRLRYELEAATSAGVKGSEALRDELASLQALLGELQDIEVRTDLLSTYTKKTSRKEATRSERLEIAQALGLLNQQRKELRARFLSERTQLAH